VPDTQGRVGCGVSSSGITLPTDTARIAMTATGLSYSAFASRLLPAFVVPFCCNYRFRFDPPLGSLSPKRQELWGRVSVSVSCSDRFRIVVAFVRSRWSEKYKDPPFSCSEPTRPESRCRSWYKGVGNSISTALCRRRIPRPQMNQDTRRKLWSQIFKTLCPRAPS